LTVIDYGLSIYKKIVGKNVARVVNELWDGTTFSPLSARSVEENTNDKKKKKKKK